MRATEPLHPPAGALTRLYLHDHGLPVLVPHLPDVQQVVGVAVVPRPAVHKDSGATAAAVHHQAVVQRGVAGVGGVYVRHMRKVPA